MVLLICIHFDKLFRLWPLGYFLPHKRFNVWCIGLYLFYKNTAVYMRKLIHIKRWLNEQTNFQLNNGFSNFSWISQPVSVFLLDMIAYNFFNATNSWFVDFIHSFKKISSIFSYIINKVYLTVFHMFWYLIV